MPDDPLLLACSPPSRPPQGRAAAAARGPTCSRSGRAEETLPHVSAAPGRGAGDGRAGAAAGDGRSPAGQQPRRGPADGPPRHRPAAASGAGGQPPRGGTGPAQAPRRSTGTAPDEFAGLEPAHYWRSRPGPGISARRPAGPAARRRRRHGHVKERLELRVPRARPATRSWQRRSARGPAAGCCCTGRPAAEDVPRAGRRRRGLGDRVHRDQDPPDVLDVMDRPQRRRNLADLFRRRPQPGPVRAVPRRGRRSARSAPPRKPLQGLRNTVSQLLSRWTPGRNATGVYVLSATNHPWDMDPALRQPGGRIRPHAARPPAGRPGAGRVLLPPARPPDRRARPRQGGAGDRRHFSGPDLAHVVDTAERR
ncbi:hypothetical protein HBB16_05515 [Pseudonocardia sp. MCCB 268]|nr:hypothetical protein [Pseudonocardia cytotoxica]